MVKKLTKQVRAGSVFIGGGAPVSVQSMTNTDTCNIEATVKQINALAAAGCDIVRVAVPCMQSASAIKEIKKQTAVPIVADIHFDYKLAVAAIEAGADKLRINPGNIGGENEIKSVVSCAAKHGIPLRIGVNSGSLEKDIASKYGSASVTALVKSAERQVKYIESLGFTDIVLSVKASSPAVTYNAAAELSALFDYPQHIGVTEAGVPGIAVIKSSAVIGGLLLRGIGDTIRISLTADPAEEVKAAVTLLRGLGLKSGANVISCPTCGRTRVSLIPLAEKVSEFCESLQKNITIAVMGCEVNGPGEAKNADIGIACGKNSGVLFKKGVVIGKYPEEELFDRLVDCINAL